MKKLFGVILGLLLVLTGGVCLLNMAGVMSFSISLDGWWTLFIIVPAISGLAGGKDRLWHFCVLLVGVYLFLAAQGIIEYVIGWKLTVPLIIVLIGVKIIVKAVSSDEEKKPEEQQTVGKSECLAVCSERWEQYAEQEVKNIKLGAIFGGIKCDLTDADFCEESEMNVFCLFGGAEIIVPDEVEVKCNGFCLFGGLNDKRQIKADVPKTARLTVNSFCLFGGADIKTK